MNRWRFVRKSKFIPLSSLNHGASSKVKDFRYSSQYMEFSILNIEYLDVEEVEGGGEGAIQQKINIWLTLPLREEWYDTSEHKKSYVLLEGL